MSVSVATRRLPPTHLLALLVCLGDSIGLHLRWFRHTSTGGDARISPPASRATKPNRPLAAHRRGGRHGRRRLHNVNFCRNPTTLANQMARVQGAQRPWCPGFQRGLALGPLWAWGARGAGRSPSKQPGQAIGKIKAPRHGKSSNPTASAASPKGPAPTPRSRSCTP